MVFLIALRFIGRAVTLSSRIMIANTHDLTTWFFVAIMFVVLVCIVIVRCHWDALTLDLRTALIIGDSTHFQEAAAIAIEMIRTVELINIHCVTLVNP